MSRVVSEWGPVTLKYEALLFRRDALPAIDLGFHVIDRVGRLDVELDGFTIQRLYEDVEEAKDRTRLDVALVAPITIVVASVMFAAATTATVIAIRNIATFVYLCARCERRQQFRVLKSGHRLRHKLCH
mgnify:CR=1 FL=1